MPFFILFSLSIGYLVHHSNPLLAYLLSPAMLTAGSVALGISGIGLLLNKPANFNWYDLFASSSLLTWFNYWHQIFNDGAPMFLLYPVYLAVIAGCITLFFILQHHEIDAHTLQYMETISKTGRFQPFIVLILVIASLLMTEHYLIYPVAMTLLMLRFAFDECLKQS
ncbi:MAG: hypothetical protein ACU85E_02015 [Gammaproteobacteria bacterium]